MIRLFLLPNLNNLKILQIKIRGFDIKGYSHYFMSYETKETTSLAGVTKNRNCIS